MDGRPGAGWATGWENRKLLINEEEAATVRFLFDRYLELKSVKALGREARDSKLTVRRANPRGGAETYRTAAFSPGNLYHLLSNPIYIGMIRHKEQLHQGEHQPIIDKDTFQGGTGTPVGTGLTEALEHQPAGCASSDRPDLRPGWQPDAAGGIRAGETGAGATMCRRLMSMVNHRHDPNGGCRPTSWMHLSCIRSENCCRIRC